MGIAINASLHQQFSTVCAASNCSNPNTLQNNGNNVHWPPGSNITFYIDPTFSPDEQAAVKAAIAAWRQTGAFSQVSYTSIDPGAPSGNNTVSIRQGIAQSSSGITSVAAGTPNVNTAPGADSSIVTGGDIAFDRNYQATVSFPAPTSQKPNNMATYTYPAYSAGSTNGGNTFLTNAMAHETGHVLGLDDNHDANGKVIDYPKKYCDGGLLGNQQQWNSTNTGSRRHNLIATWKWKRGHKLRQSDCAEQSIS